MMRLKNYLFWVVLSFTPFILTAKESVVVPYYDSVEDQYANDLLTQALASQQHPISARNYGYDVTGTRLIEAFDDRELDILWLPKEEAENTQHHIVAVPIFRGLMSYYKMVQSTYQQNLQPESQLKQLELGMFRDDAQAAYLEHSGYQIVNVKHLDNLTEMLYGERFDAILAPAARIDAKSVADFKLLPGLIAIDSPWYFVVHKSRPDLAKKLREGLTAMLLDGSMDELLLSTPWMASLYEQLQNEDALIFSLPSGTEASAELASEFWLSFDKQPLLSALN
ncbi:transporter substrate-binding domain-containing protein [Planctobacterium marinum]|uniref:transporter substrate-binding domain-containing protein n=1 Tax=Planctobacterium marinum TaxID=1631968 RepID=UPI001E42D195|nr:transporter substrate-binding domain-containing protein [Planctobacterium marinum]MCC2606351.1 transporter substrate-binding domain-containing protein [Planctobacterium marinum]